MEFAVLPDLATPTALVDALRSMGLAMVASHPSGRAWLFSDDPDRWQVLAPDADALIAVPADHPGGPHPIRVGSPLRLSELDRLAETAAARTFLLASVAGGTLVQGTLSTDRQVFWGVVDGTPVAASTLTILHRLMAPPIDDTALVLSLITSLPIQPFASRTPWSGVRAVGIGNRLSIGGDGRIAEERWWKDPGRDLDAEDAAVEVRTALYSAVGEAASGQATVSSDLSGGLDSTSICFVLRDLGQDFTAYRTSSLSASNDETERARRVARELGLPLRELAPLAESSSAFDLDVETDPRALLEGPLVWAASRRYLQDLAPAILQGGSRVHFTGLGGDELFDLVPGLLRSAWLESKPRALALIRHLQVSQRVDPRPLLAGAVGRERHAAYLRRVARVVAGDEPARPADMYSWFPPVSLPSWFTSTAREIAVEAFRSVADDPPSPLGGDPVAQQATESIAFQGKILRQFGEQFADFGIDWRGPFTDPRVLRAVLRAPAAIRFDTDLDKPLLAAAVGRAALPGFYAKRGRSDFTSDVYAEHRHRRSALAEEFESSLLVERGLIEQSSATSAVYEPSSHDVGLLDVERIVTAERWLRSAEAMKSTT